MYGSWTADNWAYWIPGVQTMFRFGTAVFSTTASMRALRLLGIQPEVRLEVASAYPILPNKTDNKVNSCPFQLFFTTQGFEYLLKQERDEWL